VFVLDVHHLASTAASVERADDPVAHLVARRELRVRIPDRFVTSQLFEVNARDPIVLGTATILVVGVIGVAVTIPAARAALINPAETLKSQ
jgi:hypothetical protein